MGRHASRKAPLAGSEVDAQTVGTPVPEQRQEEAFLPSVDTPTAATPEELAKPFRNLYVENIEAPGVAPVGSVPIPCRDGSLLTVPAHIALQIDEWLGEGREVDAGKIFEDRVVVVSHPDAQKKVFRPL